ncbi:NAD(P)/FAD-dependent oxidoreductase [Pseudoxanthomonas indica]|uniref:Glycine/D-amino acid oxidase n=1 Tax=Pseudoxanthomonas indica TaxID=428993 RepID=A0A1T5IXU6_9GAMM|nr:FAD-dependent oxidoreductase [Pseudoxanthomonas indica]GGD54960.1 oxidoreductase [Pseudoxanthomonas indica]SKC44026.1 Glycine/D-amino acid oxidase [Pseudoxanthomonas indica]
MDLKSGYPWWAVKNGLMRAFPVLDQDRDCDIAILGGGITGALIADHLQNAGHDVLVLEQRDIGWGSTAASTALLQYEIDTHLIDLIKQYGQADGALAYLACADAVSELGVLARELRDVGYQRADSLYLASRWRHARVLAQEHAARRDIGLKLEYLPGDAVRDRFGLNAPAALLSSQAAWVDPYRLAHRLLQRVAERGGGVFDRSAMVRLQAQPRHVLLWTEQGQRVRAKQVVVAAGYASQQWLDRKVAQNRSSYAFVTDPQDPAALDFLKRTMVWESARPYIYLRSTSDHRIVVGGEDDAVDVPARRDARVKKKAAKLATRVLELFPQLDMRPAFAWAGTFAETRDGLPFFGPHPQHGSRVHFAMAYGGNGITYSQIGAGLLRARIERRAHPLAKLFSFDRLDKR